MLAKRPCGVPESDRILNAELVSWAILEMGSKTQPWTQGKRDQHRLCQLPVLIYPNLKLRAHASGLALCNQERPERAYLSTITFLL